MNSFAEGGLEMYCGSPHVTHCPKCEPAKITFTQISKLQKFMWTPVMRFSLCTRTFWDGDNSCVSHSALCTGLILINFLWCKHTTTFFPVLAAEKYWSTYRLWGWCSLMIAGDSVRALLIEKDSLKMWSFVVALATTRALKAGTTVPSCSASFGNGAPPASSPHLWVLSCFFVWCS